MANPMISIICPVYNVAKYLEECLDSVERQSYKDYELICVNDGSTDASGEILNRYKNKDSRIKVLYQENKGLSAARNYGIRNANGKYICFLDSDDVLQEMCLEKIADKMVSEELDLIAFDAEIFSDDEVGCREKIEEKKNYINRNFVNDTVLSGRKLFCKMIESNCFICCVCLFAIRRDLLLEEEIMFEEEITQEDILYSVICFLKAKHTDYIGEKLYLYRIRRDSLSTAREDELLLYSYIVIYNGLMKQILLYKKEKEIQDALTVYINSVIDRMYEIDDTLSSESKCSSLLYEGDIKLSCMLLGVGVYSEKWLYDEIFGGNLFLNNKKILIYGAGTLGNVCYDYLLERGLSDKVEAFIVTEIKDNNSVIKGKQIIAIDNYNGQPNGKVLFLAAGRNFQKEMYIKAIGKGFKTIIPISKRMIIAMKSVYKNL